MKKSLELPSEKYEFEKIADSEDIPFEQRKTNWFSIYVAAALAFLGCIQMGLYFSSVWPYLQQIDNTVTENFLGIVIAAYSLGDLISSPIFGHWSHKISKIKPLLYFGFSFMLFGNLIYVSAGMMKFGQKYLILFARFMTGFGFAYTSLLRAYAVSASMPADRSKAIAWITGGIALGSTTGPALQLIFTPLGTIGFHFFGALYLNIFTGPAILACAINFGAYFLIYFCFTERNIGVINKQIVKEKGMKLPQYDKVAVFICYLTTFCIMFVVINLETINAPLATTVFAFSKIEVVRYTAMAELFRCLMAFLTYFSYIYYNFGRTFNSRKIVVFAVAGFLTFHLITYSWPFLPGQLQMFDSDSQSFSSNTSNLVGCDFSKYQWCQDFNPISPYLYYPAFIFFIGACLPNLNISLHTLFSKIIGPRPQAIQQGWLQVAGSSGRMLGPITMSALYVKYGPRWSWNAEILLISMTLGCWIFMRNRMIPLEIPKEYAEFHDKNDPDMIKKFAKTQK